MKYVHRYQSFLCQVQSQKKAVDLLSGLAYNVDLKTVKSYILIIITLIHQRLSHRITRHFLLLKWGFFSILQFCYIIHLFLLVENRMDIMLLYNLKRMLLYLFAQTRT